MAKAPYQPAPDRSAPRRAAPERGGVRRVVFRADAGQRIGTGHVMRCLSIADGLVQAGAKAGLRVNASFVCKAHQGHMAAQLRRRGYDCDLLPLTSDWRPQAQTAEDYLGWLGGPVDQDAQLTQAAIAASGGADLLIVDHYALDAAYQRQMAGAVPHIAVIEDLPNRLHDCDILIDQNIGHDETTYAGRVPARTTLLVGPRYAPIMPEFVARRQGALNRIQALSRPKVLLICLGGADPDNVTLAALQALRGTLWFDRVEVVLSGIARNLEVVRAELANHPKAYANVTLHVDTTQMPQLMADSDLSIGAAGVTAIERCVLGLPTLMVVVADNQIEVAQRMASLGAVMLLGDTAGVTAEKIHEALAAFMTDQTGRLQNMSQAAANLCDGQGLDRIGPALLKIMSQH